MTKYITATLAFFGLGATAAEGALYALNVRGVAFSHPVSGFHLGISALMGLGFTLLTVYEIRKETKLP